MKRIAAVILLLTLAVGSAACSRLIGEDYYSVQEHVEQKLPEELPTEETLPTVVTNRNELRGAVLSFIRNWTERGTIYVENYEGEINADLSETMEYATAEDPVGAYAVDYADAELSGDGQDGSIELNIVFRRSAAEIDAIVTVNDNLVAEEMIRQALQNYDTALTLRIRNYSETDFVAYIRRYCLEHPEEVGALPTFSAAVYPREGDTRILELHFEYAHTRDEMHLMQDSVATVLRSAASYVRKGQNDTERAELLARFLLLRFSYSLGTEEPSMPAYELLHQGIAHSLSFASVVYAECSSAGMECLMVSGTRNGAPHYWNLIRLDEVYYHVDLMRSVERGEKELTLLQAEEVAEEGYGWDTEAYPSNPQPTEVVTELPIPFEPSQTPEPTAEPTEEPTSEQPTEQPTNAPSEPPSQEPTEPSDAEPTEEPTQEPVPEPTLP